MAPIYFQSGKPGSPSLRYGKGPSSQLPVVGNGTALISGTYL